MSKMVSENSVKKIEK